MAAHTSHRTLARLVAYLDDIYFPCSRHELLRRAEENEAPDALLDAIEELPDRSYWSVRDIMVRISADAGSGITHPVAQPAPASQLPQLAARTHAQL
jgi:hypothetical protein